jgi:hypothetical protein
MDAEPDSFTPMSSGSISSFRSPPMPCLHPLRGAGTSPAPDRDDHMTVS